jgi:PAS domain S-box-containing protein
MSDAAPAKPEDLSARLAELEQTLARRTREMAALNETSMEINSQPNLSTLLNAIVEKAAALCSAHMGGLYLLQPDGETLELVVAYHLPGNFQGATIKLGEGLSGQIAQSGELMMIPDYSAWAGRAAIFSSGHFRRVLGVPLKVRDKIIGVINVTDNQKTGPFDADEVRLVSLFADQAAIAIEHTRLYEAAQRELADRTRAQRIQTALFRIAEAVHATPNLDDLYRAIHATIHEWMPADNFYIALYDATTDLLDWVYFVDECDTWSPPQPPGRSLTAYVLRTGKPLLATPDVFDGLLARGEVELVGTPSIDWLGVPLQVNSAPIGALVVQSYTEGVRLTEEHKNLLVFVSDQVAMAIERKRAVEALRRSEREYRTLFAEAQRQTQELALLDRVRSALTRELDLTTVFRTVVEAIAATFGYTLVSLYMRRGDVLYLQHQVGYHDEIPTIALDAGVVGRIARTGQPELIEDAHADPDFVEAFKGITSEVGVPLFDEGQVVGVLNIESVPGVPLTRRDLQLMMALSEHISAAIHRARLYTEARDSAARLRTAFESLPFNLWVMDRDGSYIMQNSSDIRQWGRMIGKRADEVVSDPEVLKRWQANDRRALAGEVVPSDVEVVRGGQTRFFHEVVAPIRNGDQIDGVLGASIDITDRVRMEDALRQAQKMESLGILAGGIAHDFNNLLVALLSQMSLALSKLPADSPARDHIEKAVTAAERAAALTRQMLAFSGRGQFAQRPINFNDLLHDNLHLFEVALPKNVQLRSKLAEALPLIDGDTGQMQQVIKNLIINAGEAIGERPGVVTVSTYPQAIGGDDAAWWKYTGELLAPGQYVTLEVHDTGTGMDPETLSRMFDPFFTTKFTGRGLGLAAVLGIVRGHKGGLQVDSAPGTGTLFRLIFPVSATPPVEQATHEELPRIEPTGQVILVIDDEEPVRIAVTDILELAGLSVITAADGEEGIALFREHRPDIRLVLLDLSMPGLSGEETFNQLCQIDPAARIVLSSGYNELEVTRRFAGLGVTGFIQKPYDAVALTNAIQRYLKTLA